MVRVALLAFVPALLASVALGAPLSKRQVNFAVQDYAAFQISDGQTGNAKAEAAAIFVDPFANVDLATLDDSVATNMETMRKAAEAAETDQFNPAIDAAGGTKTDAGAALQNGKIKNKVLKLTAETQVLKIKLAKAQAAGDDTASISAKIAVEQKKLDNNIATDTKNAGQVSQGVTGGAAATTDTTGTDTTTTDTTDTSAAASASATTTKTKTGKKAKGTKAASTAAASTAAASSDAAATATASASADASTATTATTGTNDAATATTFKLQDYAAFQISDGTAGDAQGKAEAIFVDPFDNVDLATLDDQVAKDIETMRQAAEAAETDKFNPAIDAAGGTSSADGAALQAGKIQNKVLKLTAETQGLKIKIAKAQAAGTDTASLTTKLAAEQKKLDTNIATDEKNDGKASKGVA